MINGIIFQRDDNRDYKGVEGDNWYLNNIFSELLEDFFGENIEKSWYDSNYVDVCNDYSFIEKYIELSKRENIKFRMLLCETDRLKPRLTNINWKTKFIGYDYAYLGGSYYSAVYNDIYSKRIQQFLYFKLNCNGLFEHIENLNEFIRLREDMISQDNNMILEQGDFTIYKLYEINL